MVQWDETESTVRLTVAQNKTKDIIKNRKIW